MFAFSFYSIVILSLFFCVLSLAVVVFVGSKKYSSRSFTVFLLFLSFWILSAGLFYSTINEDLAHLTLRSCYFFGTLISLSFFHFALSYPYNYKPSFITKITLVAISIISIPLYYSSELLPVTKDLFLLSVEKFSEPIFCEMLWSYKFGTFAFFFDIIFFCFWFVGLATLYYKKNNKKFILAKKQISHIYITMLFGVIPAGILIIILPRLGIFDFFWLGIIPIAGSSIFMSYSIMEYGQMNIKTASTEFLVLVAAGLLFLSIFV
ncbi:MAG: hypothetical protein KAS07_00630 [Candidatus Pacebacteria bacterium]|nr:hypothetical protein [Candidatus Paceibacterota bacterium]